MSRVTPFLIFVMRKWRVGRGVTMLMDYQQSTWQHRLGKACVLLACTITVKKTSGFTVKRYKTCVHVCVCACVCVHACMCACVRACAYMRACMRVCMCACVCVHIEKNRKEQKRIEKKRIEKKGARMIKEPRHMKSMTIKERDTNRWLMYQGKAIRNKYPASKPVATLYRIINGVKLPLQKGKQV